jgi:hypothetical protein
VAGVVVHLWHRQPDPSKVMTLKATMKATRGMSHARLVIHSDEEQQPGCTVIEGADAWEFDLRLFRQMVNDIF